MRYCRRFLCSLAVNASFGASFWTPSFAADPLGYRLAPETQYEEGCFAPCLCPVMIRSGVSGTFVAVPLEPDGSYRVFAIERVQWFVPDPALLVRGSGTFRIDTTAFVQRLELDLQVGNDPVEHYDSGLVPVHAKFPDIDVVISVHGMYCWDIVFDLKARSVRGDPLRSRNDLAAARGLAATPADAPGPARNAPLALSSTWSALKSLYREPSPAR